MYSAFIEVFNLQFFPIASNVEYSYKRLTATCVHTLMKYLLMSLAHFLIFFFLLVSFKFLNLTSALLGIFCEYLL